MIQSGHCLKIGVHYFIFYCLDQLKSDILDPYLGSHDFRAEFSVTYHEIIDIFIEIIRLFYF